MNHASGIRLPDCSKLAINLKNDNDFTIWRHDVIAKFFWSCRFLSSLVTSPIFMSISLLVLELWQFLFIRDWPEIRKYPAWVLSNTCRLGQNYLMLLNARFIAFTISEILREYQQGEGLKLTCPHPTRLGLIYVNLR